MLTRAGQQLGRIEGLVRRKKPANLSSQLYFVFERRELPVPTAVLEGKALYGNSFYCGRAQLLNF